MAGACFVKKCEICEQGEVTLKTEDGIEFYQCNQCQAEYLPLSELKPKTTKQCPKCNCDKMVSFHSTNEKQCPDCLTVIPWTLDKGQKSVFNDKKSD